MKFVLMAYEAKHPNLGNATESATHLLNIPETSVLKIDHLDALALVAVQCGLIVRVFVDGNNRKMYNFRPGYPPALYAFSQLDEP